MNKISLNLITMFGIGNISKIPGTIASFITSILFLFLFVAEINIYVLLLIFFVVLVFSPNIIDKNIHQFNNLDPKEIVIDEFIGQSIPCLWICYKLKVYGMLGTVASPPLLPSILPFLIAFISFRFFDILKPFPINLIDKKIKNGFGVVLDDVVAGIFAAISTHLLLSLIY